MTFSRNFRSTAFLIIALTIVLPMMSSSSLSLPPLADLLDIRPKQTAEPVAFDAKVARTQLATLRVASEAPMAGYDRAARFGRWMDTDHDGCNSRAEILGRDGSDVRHAPNCIVSGGKWRDDYTGETIETTTVLASSRAVQIDHIVPLAEAWRSGAANWSDNRRRAFANDPINLNTSDASANMSKGDKDAAQWLPPNAGYHAAYAAQVIAVKAKYGLRVDRAERAKLAQLIAS